MGCAITLIRPGRVGVAPDPSRRSAGPRGIGEPQKMISMTNRKMSRLHRATLALVLPVALGGPVAACREAAVPAPGPAAAAPAASTDAAEPASSAPAAGLHM